MTAAGCDCKVGRTAERYGLDDLDAALLERRDAGASLRDLAGYVNRRVLRAAIERADGDLLSGGEPLFGALDPDEVVETVYETLADEGVEAERRARVRTRLAQAAVDVDRAEADWVTHPTVRAHLRDCLDVDTSASPALSAGEGLDTVEWAVARCTGVVEQTLQRLRSAGRLAVTAPEVDVSVRITCTECGTTYAPAELLDAGRCDCRDDR